MQFAPLGLVTRARVQPQLELVELGFAQHARQAQQQPVVVGARIVQPLAVGKQRAEYTAEFDQPMPIAMVPGQARGFAAKHEADTGQADLGDQLLKAGALVGPGGRLAQVFVDHPHPLARPAQRDGSLDQFILELGAFAVVDDLRQGRLADVHVGQPGLLLHGDRRLEWTQDAHWCSPP